MPKLIAQKEDWIELGYQLFANQGIVGIVVEKMAKQLKCNKSSFYWHFKTKDEFVLAVIQYWSQIETEHIIEQVESVSNPREQLDLFLQIAFKNDPYLEFIHYLLRYAQTRPTIQKIVDDITKRRLDFTTNMFLQLGYKRQEATTKARIFYYYLIGYHETIKNKKQDKNYMVEVTSDLKHFLNL